jgi:hypothetical protein
LHEINEGANFVGDIATGRIDGAHRQRNVGELGQDRLGTALFERALTKTSGMIAMPWPDSMASRSA